MKSCGIQKSTKLQYIHKRIFHVHGCQKENQLKCFFFAKEMDEKGMHAYMYSTCMVNQFTHFLIPFVVHKLEYTHVHVHSCSHMEQ